MASASCWRGEVNIEPLTSKLAALDTVAYTDSPDAIRRHSAGRWPTDGFTMAENLTLIATHEAEHHAGVAFAYSLLNVARDRELGVPTYVHSPRSSADRDAPRRVTSSHVECSDRDLLAHR